MTTRALFGFIEEIEVKIEHQTFMLLRILDTWRNPDDSNFLENKVFY